MKFRDLPFLSALLLSALLLSALLLSAGCGGGVKPVETVNYPNFTGNRQIQTYRGFGTVLVGSLVEQGSKFTGTFRFADLDPSSTCGPAYQTVSLTGTMNTTGLLTLQTSRLTSGSTVQGTLQEQTSAYGINYGTIAVVGSGCQYALASSFGILIAPVNGTFIGTLQRGTSVNNSQPGSTYLSLGQSATAAADGQFPMTGSLSFSGTNCSSSANLTGTVSGENLQLSSPPDPVTGISEVNISAVPNVSATQLAEVTVTFGSGPCAAGVAPFNQYSGMLSK